MKIELNTYEFINLCITGTTHEQYLIKTAINLNVEYELINLLEELTENNIYGIVINDLRSYINSGALNILNILESEDLQDYENLIFELKEGVYLSIE